MVRGKARWLGAGSLSPDWDRRTRFVANLLPKGLVIADVGCGSMELKRAAHPTEYRPIDIVSRGPGTLVIDLNAEPLPAGWLAGCDLVTALGALEYLEDCASLFRTVAASGATFVCSYKALDLNPGLDRDQNDWINHFAVAELETMLEREGLELRGKFYFDKSEVVFIAAPVGAQSRLAAARTRTVAKPSLVVAGFYGRGNCGDEALLQCVEAAFGAEFALTISVDEHGAFPGFWDWHPYNRSKIIHQTNLSEFRDDPSIAGFLIGGGGLPPGFALNQALAARSFGIPTALAGCDAFWSDDPRWSAENAFRPYAGLFDVFALRSEQAVEQARSVNAAPIYGGDWALNLPMDESEEVTTNHRCALVVVRELPLSAVDMHYVREVERLLAGLRTRALEPVFLPFAPEDERFLAILGLDSQADSLRCWWNPRRCKQWIARSGRLISIGRLHPVIFAASVGTPCAALAVPTRLSPPALGHKLRGMCAELGVPVVHGVDALLAGIEDLAAAPESLVAAARARTDAMIGTLRSLFGRPEFKPGRSDADQTGGRLDCAR